MRGNHQSNESSIPPCVKHVGEILKLFCKSCDQLICRDCTVIDHRDHKYTFINDIFPVVKEEILDIVQESRANIRALESSIGTIKEQEDDMHKTSMEFNRKVDSFFDKQIEPIERKRQSIKDDLRESFSAQKKILDAQMESFASSLDCLKSSVEFTEEALTKGSGVKILSAKNQMIQQLTELHSATSDLKPRGRICLSLELTDSSLIEVAALENVAKITEYDEEYELLKKSGLTRISEDLQSPYKELTKFIIRPKSKSSSLDQANKVQVTITAPPSPPDVFSRNYRVPVTSEPAGSFGFCFKPELGGDYKIEVLINGRYVHGSPFAWKVDKSYIQKTLAWLS